jgi:hypothetical protein
VRTAYESLRAEQTVPASSPLGLTHRDPSISDEDPGTDRYLVPSFSRTSAADGEVVLDDLLASLHRQNFHFVGIVATDVHDATFLIHEIRDNCPDTIPFLTSADLLYLHSDYNRDLAGTLIFSTYPLFASNQIWTGSFDDRHLYQFPSGEAEGLYNAVLSALSDPQGMVEYASPFASVSKEPPLWVSVVGNDELWPVSIYPGEPGDYVSHYVMQRSPTKLIGSLPSDFRTSLYPRAFDITFTLVILLCTIPPLYMIAMTRALVSRPSEGPWRAVPRPPHGLVGLFDDSVGFATVSRSD